MLIEHLGKMVKAAGIWFLMAVVPADSIAGAPSGSDLLDACEQSLLTEFAGLPGQMCLWYAIPCQCKVDQSTETTQVCLPPGLADAGMAEAVVRGLKQYPQLQQLDAADAARLVLELVFPCMPADSG